MIHRIDSLRAAPLPLEALRTLYVVDLENIVGKGELDVADAEDAERRILQAIPSVSGDQTIIAVSHHNALAAGLGWRGSAQRCWRSGADGADLALLESIHDVSWIARRFQRVVIASGDHAFALAVRALKVAGLAVTIVSTEDSVSSTIRRAAGQDIVLLPRIRPLPMPILINTYETSLIKDAA